jgi:hypothetical protein
MSGSLKNTVPEHAYSIMNERDGLTTKYCIRYSEWVFTFSSVADP